MGIWSHIRGLEVESNASDDEGEGVILRDEDQQRVDSSGNHRE